MTDKQTLFEYRLQQSEITLADAKKMIQSGISPLSVVNRAYYAMFYMILALFIKMNINVKTSKHTGAIGLFDKEFIISGKIDRKYSKMLHAMFDDRQEFDYKEFTVVSGDDAVRGITYAEEFIDALKKFISEAENSSR
ncbi:MAG: HEPN domain-containing protein [Desulfobacterales bacterium]|nr:HEPN domain-containing protein [Desulfobacterales bacterium]